MLQPAFGESPTLKIDGQKTSFGSLEVLRDVSLPVDKVICAGRVVVEDGHYIAGDAGEIWQGAARHRIRVLEKANG